MHPLAIALVALAAPSAAPGPAPPTALERAVDAFNAHATRDPIGREQPPLTPEAVVAAVRWSLIDGADLQVDDPTRASLEELATTGALAPAFELESLTGYEPDHRHVFEVWSVRLRIPGGPHPDGTTCISIQERMLRSRVIGPEERRVIEAWAPRFRDGIPSMGFEQYRAERERAAARDRERDH